MEVGRWLVVAVAVTLFAPGAAGAVDRPPGPHRTLRVCHTGKHCIRTIQAAVRRARAGDTIRVADGTYHEGVEINGSGKRFLTLIGDRRHPSRVVLEGRLTRTPHDQNAVQVAGADHVTIDGFRAQHYKANGFLVSSVTGYALRHLQAVRTGAYGAFAFNSRGGEMSDSDASWNDDGGFYIGQTPPQRKPGRSIVRNVRSWGNVLGFSGTNMRYVTITKSQFFDNGLGIALTALDSERYAPPEDNVVVGNEVFWNNFDYYEGAPFTLPKPGAGEPPYPVGVGILMFGGRRNEVTDNRVYGNYLLGAGALKQFLLKQTTAQDLVGNRVTGNRMGLDGTDRNGRDLLYDGSGSGNCFGANPGVQSTVPVDGATFVPCPFSGTNAFDPDAQSQAVAWGAGDPTHEANWLRSPHAAKPGYRPLEAFKRGSTPLTGYAPPR